MQQQTTNSPYLLRYGDRDSVKQQLRVQSVTSPLASTISQKIGQIGNGQSLMDNNRVLQCKLVKLIKLYSRIYILNLG